MHLLTSNISKTFLALTFAIVACVSILQVTASVQPQAAYAQTGGYKGLVQCDGVKIEGSDRPVCNFKQLVASINYLVKWLFAIAGALAIVLFTWAGFLYMSGVEKNIAKAKGIFMHVVGGLIIMLCAWFIVYTIISWIAAPEADYATSLLENSKK